jgi:energy-coupling factor transporter ATP-binding protein EcfA2
MSTSISSTPSTLSSVEKAREKILRVQKTLSRHIVGQENMIKGVIVATVAGEHAVIIGPPGTGKSMTIRTLSELLDARFYQYLLTRFTTFEELFGYIDILALSTKNEYRRNWSMITTADFVFLDEIFKANSSILNTLLSIMQERIVYDPFSGTPVRTQLWSLFGASNEVPDDPDLQALYDRFSVKIFIDYIGRNAGSAQAQSTQSDPYLDALNARWRRSSLKPIASMGDIRVLNQYAEEILRKQIGNMGSGLEIYHQNFIPIIKALQAKGFIVSDRTVIEKLPKLFASYLAIYGLFPDNIVLAPYEILPWIARSRSELRDITKFISDSMGDVNELMKILSEARDLFIAGNLSSAKEKLLEIMNYDLGKLASKPWLRTKAETIVAAAREYLQEINRNASTGET